MQKAYMNGACKAGTVLVFKEPVSIALLFVFVLEVNARFCLH
jgi:hypothetical protein